MLRKFVFAVLASAAFFPLALHSTPAHAQQSSAATAAPRIDGFDVDPAARPVPGAELEFTLYGTSGGTASVAVGGGTSSLILREVEAGVYEGTYTIGSRDRINDQSTATANLRVGNRVASSVLDESLVAGASARWPGGSAAANAAPRIDRFDVDPPARLQPGAELLFTLLGSPGATASVRLQGVRGKIALEEIAAGRYEGGYTVKNRDRISADTVVTGNLRLATQERTKVLGQSLVESTPSSRARAGSKRVAAAPQCANCGVVEAINVVEHKGEGSYLGMIAGGVAGALLGSQVGEGRGTTVAQVAGAAAGGFAGNEIEKRMKTTKHYEVVVRLENGGSQMVSYPASPAFAVGSRVKVENGTLVAN